MCDTNPRGTWRSASHSADLIDKLTEAIPIARTVDPFALHKQVAALYTWEEVAGLIARLRNIAREDRKGLRQNELDGAFALDRSTEKVSSTLPLTSRYYGCGVWAGKLFCVIIALGFLIWRFLEWFQPRQDIELAVDFPYKKYRDNKNVVHYQ